MPQPIAIVETPRDAFQGLPKIIPTAQKIRYIQTLIDAGFKHLDLGGFVTRENLPQLADTEAVVKAFAGQHALERIALVQGRQGMQRAFDVGGLDALGFSLSLSRQFQIMNASVTTTQSWPLLETLIADTEAHDMSFILYLSMAFGNPYAEPWEEDMLFALLRPLSEVGVRHVSLADTTGVATPEQIGRVMRRAHTELPQIQFGAHLHARPGRWVECVQAGVEAGCRRFDAACGGLGGCPQVQDAMVQNIPSEELVLKLEECGYSTGVDPQKAAACAALAREFQQQYGS